MNWKIGFRRNGNDIWKNQNRQNLERSLAFVRVFGERERERGMFDTDALMPCSLMELRLNLNVTQVQLVVTVWLANQTSFFFAFAVAFTVARVFAL